MESLLFVGGGSMFVGSQNFRGRNFVDSVIRIILMNIEQMIVYRFVGV